MSEFKYSDQEISEVWSDLNSAKKELEAIETKDAEPKKELLERIRDKVRILVKAEKIPIKQSQIMSYVWNILDERDISYSKGHFSELFNDQEKRNYSKSSQGNIHQHSFKIMTEIPQGKWEQCQCGTNRLNGIEQMDLSSETQEESSEKLIVRETIEPQEIQFEYLKLIKELFSQNIHAIDTIIQKCTLDITSIKKQTTENKKRQAPQVDYEKLFNSTKLLVDKRVNIVLGELSDVNQAGITKTKKSISDIIHSIKLLNDRTKITSYEKAVAKILINKFAFFVGDIAKILNITTKHVKNNILKLNSPSSVYAQDGILEQLDYLVRCTGCGLGVADHFEREYENFKKGKPITENFELGSFALPTYAKQVIQLKQQLRKNRIQTQKLKEKLESKK